jgi:DNA-binding transcriptional LysR family regulator
MKTSNLSYKHYRMQQLQCLCETARLGSFVAAAAALDVSHPTVWKQVHALEHEFGVQLVEPHGRGCHLTAAGQLLVGMAGPAVESIETLGDRFRAALHDTGTGLNVAVTPKILQTELAPCLGTFHGRFPKTRIGFLEVPTYEVADTVEDRRADFGFTATPLTEEQQRALTAEPAYTLEVRLITPKDHPLARRRTVRLRDLRPYPLVNRDVRDLPLIEVAGDSWQTYLGARGAEDSPGREMQHLVQADFSASIRRLVELGYGIGFTPEVPRMPSGKRFHERPMNRYFGSVLVQVIRRRGAFTPPAGEEFISLVRRELMSEAL